MGKIIAIYQYKNLDGSIAHETVRYEPKNFRQRRPDGKGGYIYSLNGIKTVLYRLPEITEAIKNDIPVCIVEGEKDADNLAKLGLQATTNAMGARKWSMVYNIVLSGSRVAIMPDNDTAGREHAYMLANKLYPWCECVKIVWLPGQGKDVSDWIANGGTKEQLQELINAAPVYIPLNIQFEYKRWLRARTTKELLAEVERLQNEGRTKDEPLVEILITELKYRCTALEHKAWANKYIKALVTSELTQNCRPTKKRQFPTMSDKNTLSVLSGLKLNKYETPTKNDNKQVQNGSQN